MKESRMEDKRSAYRILMGKTLRERLLGKS